MSHPSFERWIFEGPPLAPEQAAALAEHLAECAACRALHAGWVQAAGLLRDDAGLLPPAPGFGARWIARHRAGEARAHHRQVSIALGLLACGALAGLAVLAVVFAAWLGSPADLLGAAMRRALEIWMGWELVWGLGGALLRSLPAPAPYAAAGGACVLLAAVGGLWGWIVYRYSPQPVRAASGGGR